MLYVASQSPQRSAILNSLSVEIACIKTDFNEKTVPLVSLSPTQQAVELAKAKLQYALTHFPYSAQAKNTNNDALITADTIVYLNKHHIYGKPQSEQDARKMLVSYSGKAHFVVTALAGYSFKKNKTYTIKSVSKVWFSHLSTNDIDTIINWKEWEEAAGAYRIQGRSAYYIKKIKGSYSGIVGFPIREFYKLAYKLQLKI